MAETRNFTTKKAISGTDVETELGEIDTNRQQTDTDKPLLLVIDDNEDIRNMLRQLLSDEYTVILHQTEEKVCDWQRNMCRI